MSKQRLLTVSFAVIFNLLLAGSVCGTFAWYTYATRTGFEKQYHGVTVGDSGEIETGILSTVELEDYNLYSLVEDKITLADENKIIYWCEHTVDSRTINYVISANGSATNMMHPVTTGSDVIINYDDFHLFKAPKPLLDYSLDETSYAEQTDYVYIPFVFRYIDEDEDFNKIYLPNKEIFFTKCDVRTSLDSPEKEVYRSVRVFAKNETEGYVINPTAEEDGQTNVGGILDLNNDGFYDYDSSGYEHLYGESESFAYHSDVTQSDGTLPSSERTTFISNHKKDKYALNEDTYVPKTVSYNSMKKFINKSQPIAITNGDYHNLATLDFYVYSEGWDLHVIDEENGSGFNMDLRFEVEL